MSKHILNINSENFLHRVQILILTVIFFLSFFSTQSFAQTEVELKKMMEQLKSLGDSLENYQDEVDSESQKQGEAFKKLFVAAPPA